MEIVVRIARFPDDAPTVRTLFGEYAAGLDIDLSFQGFAAELDSLPGAYAAPAGAVLIAEAAGMPLGCVAVRPLEGRACEMKRLYVKAGARGRRIGDALVSRICALARARGYALMRLDTLASMNAALQLYARAGFRPIPPYIFNPIAGACYLELDLSTVAPTGTD
jgi:ribosomal protein S18 acetylase RimI-like enzyme